MKINVKVVITFYLNIFICAPSLKKVSFKFFFVVFRIFCTLPWKKIFALEQQVNNKNNVLFVAIDDTVFFNQRFSETLILLKVARCLKSAD